MLFRSAFVSLIEKPKCYEGTDYWRFLTNENFVSPLSIKIKNNKFYKNVIVNNPDPIIDNFYTDVKKRILNYITGKHKIAYSCIEKFSTPFPYFCDRKMPSDDTSLGVPSPVPDDYSGFNNYEGEWGYTAGGNKLYCARVFINDDFEGGNLVFPQHKMDVKPVRNRMVLYPCSEKYVYGVRKVNGGSFHLSYWFSKF